MSNAELDEFNKAVVAINKSGERLVFLLNTAEAGDGTVDWDVWGKTIGTVCAQQQLALKALLETVRPLLPRKPGLS